MQKNPAIFYDRKTLQTRTRMELPQPDKRHLQKKKSITNIIINGDILNAFLLRSGTRQRYTILPLLFKIVLENLYRKIRQQREIKSI